MKLEKLQEEKLDADDGSYDGNIDIEVLNHLLKENGFRTYDAKTATNNVPFIDVVKMIYNLKQEQKATGAVSIKVDLILLKKWRKARKQYEKWR